MPDVNAPGGAQQEDDSFNGPLHNILICKDCREYPPNLVEEFAQGDIVCGSCGLVLSDRIIDTRSEWRTFANDDQSHDDPNRVGDGVNHLLNGSQLETSIGSAENAKGRAARDLSRIQNKATELKSNKVLLQAYKEIQVLCDGLDAGKQVAEVAKHIFKLVDDEKLLKGKPQEAVIAGCIFIACRQCGAARTFRDIFNLTKVSKKEIGRVFKALETFLQKHKERNSNDGVSLKGYENTTSTNAEDLCERYCSRLGFTNPHLFDRVACELARQASGIKPLAGRSPLSIAAACIYMTSHLLGEPKTSKDIASVAGVSDGTIKTAYKFLYAEKDALIDPDSPALKNIAKSNAASKKEASQGKKGPNFIQWSVKNLPFS